MRIMISHDGSPAHLYIRTGLARAFSACGHDVVLWDLDKKPAFDAFDKFQPDILFTQTYNLNESLIKCIIENKNLKVAMKASDWGIISDSIDRNKYPVLIANDKEIKNVLDLKDKTGKPDFIYVHYTEKRLKDTHTHWSEKGLQVESFLNAADIFNFTNGQEKVEYKSDLGFVGGRWGYKSQTIDKWLLPLCGPKRKYSIKIFGNQGWGIPEYCGFIPDDEVKHFLASCKICPNISEPHSQDFGYDVIERPFKLLSNKCFCISDHVDDMAELLPSIPLARSPLEFRELIEYWLNSGAEDKKQQIIQDGYKYVMSNHTYFHRASHLLKKFNLINDADEILSKYNDIERRLTQRDTISKN